MWTATGATKVTLSVDGRPFAPIGFSLLVAGTPPPPEPKKAPKKKRRGG